MRDDLTLNSQCLCAMFEMNWNLCTWLNILTQDFINETIDSYLHFHYNESFEYRNWLFKNAIETVELWYWIVLLFQTQIKRKKTIKYRYRVNTTSILNNNEVLISIKQECRISVYVSIFFYSTSQNRIHERMLWLLY